MDNGAVVIPFKTMGLKSKSETDYRARGLHRDAARVGYRMCDMCLEDLPVYLGGIYPNRKRTPKICRLQS